MRKLQKKLHKKLEKASVPAEETQKGSENLTPESTEKPKEDLIQPEAKSEVETASDKTQKEVEVKLPEYSLLEKAETMNKTFC